MEKNLNCRVCGLNRRPRTFGFIGLTVCGLPQVITHRCLGNSPTGSIWRDRENARPKPASEKATTNELPVGLIPKHLCVTVMPANRQTRTFGSRSAVQRGYAGKLGFTWLLTKHLPLLPGNLCWKKSRRKWHPDL